MVPYTGKETRSAEQEIPAQESNSAEQVPKRQRFGPAPQCEADCPKYQAEVDSAEKRFSRDNHSAAMAAYNAAALIGFQKSTRVIAQFKAKQASEKALALWRKGHEQMS